MALYETEAVILRTYNLAEADKIVVCLSRSSGLIRGVAKGSRKLKNRFGSSLEPFTFVDLTFYQKENRELVSIRQTEILRSHFNLSSDATILTGLAYIGDLLIEFSPPHQANDKLFRMVSACFDAVSKAPGDLESILRYFEVWLLKIEGFLPDLRNCAECHREFDAETPIYLSPELGLRCRTCSDSRGGVVSSSLQLHLRTTANLPPGEFAEQARVVPTQTKRELAELTHQLIGRVLERLPRVRPTFVQ